LDRNQNQYLDTINFNVMKINVYMDIFQGILHFYFVSNAPNYSLLVLWTVHIRQKSNNPLLKHKHIQNKNLWNGGEKNVQKRWSTVIPNHKRRLVYKFWLCQRWRMRVAWGKTCTASCKSWTPDLLHRKPPNYKGWGALGMVSVRPMSFQTLSAG